MFLWWSETLVGGGRVVVLNGDLRGEGWACLMSKGIWFLGIRILFLGPLSAVGSAHYRFR